MKKRFSGRELMLLLAPCIFLGALGLMWRVNKTPQQLAVRNIEFQALSPQEVSQGYNRKIVISPQFAKPLEVPNAKYVGGDFFINETQFVCFNGTSSRVIKGVKQHDISKTSGERTGNIFKTTAQTIILLFNDKSLPAGKITLHTNLYQTFVYNNYRGGKATGTDWRYNSIPIVVDIPNTTTNQKAN